MKRKISLILSIIMLVMVCIPGFVHADNGMSLEDAIKFTKGVLEIPEEYEEFNYGLSTYYGKKVWDFSWNKDDMYGGSINVRMDDSGDILHYYKYNFKDIENSKKIPVISRDEAQIIAEKFIEKLNSPEFFNNLKLIELNQKLPGESVYSFYYIGIYDGISVPFNSINISVNYNTGEIQIYNKSWTEDVKFPKSDDAISMKEAEEVYKEALGLRLTYNLAGDKVYLAYTPIYGNEYVIDAISGEATNLMPGIIGAYDEALSIKESFLAGRGEYKEVVLSPEEIKTIEESGELISQEEAENIVREFDIFEMDDSFKLEFASLGRSWGVERNYIWNISFLKEQSKESRESREYQYINVSLNAKTGEIINFDISYPGEEGDRKYSEEEARVIVEEFLEKMQPEKFKNTEYDDLYQEKFVPISVETEENSHYRFKYTRIENEIPFVDNSFIVRFDGVKGKIYGFNMTWQELDFPSAKNVLSLDKIYNLFFEEVGLSLEYREENLYPVYSDSSVANVMFDTAVDVVSDLVVDTAVDVVSDLVVDTAVDIAPDVVVDTAVDVVSDVVVDTAVDVVSDVVVDTAVDIAPDVVAEETDKFASLIYAVNSKKPSRLDAFTGELLNADGEVYIEDAPIEYTDISEHYAKKQIETLAQMGIALEGPIFRPNEKIKQKDFLLLISQVIDRGYTFYNKTALENDSETDKLYDLLIREGIVKEDEKNPEASLTREESVKFVIRALKYDKIGDLKDIFKCDFLDKEEIDSDLIGYVVLAKGFNIVNGYGDYFRPKEELKRADAVIIIYNYLKI